MALTSHVRRERKHALRQAQLRMPVDPVGELEFPFVVDDFYVKSALKRFIPTPIRFDSIVLGPVHGVSGSHAAAALLRACTTRADYSAALGPATDAASSTDTAAAVPAGTATGAGTVRMENAAVFAGELEVVVHDLHITVQLREVRLQCGYLRRELSRVPAQLEDTGGNAT